MTTRMANLPASVAARLLNHARRTGEDYQTLLTSFCLERFLYRLGLSEVRDRFVLKGAMLLRLWSDQRYRATRDLDLLRQGNGSFAAIRADLGEICAVSVEPDAVEFLPDAISIEAIRIRSGHTGRGGQEDFRQARDTDHCRSAHRSDHQRQARRGLQRTTGRLPDPDPR